MMNGFSIRTNVGEGEQECSFANATLNYAADTAFSIATHVRVPDEIAAQGQHAVAAYLVSRLSPLASDAMRIDVQVGPVTGRRSGV